MCCNWLDTRPATLRKILQPVPARRRSNNYTQRRLRQDFIRNTGGYTFLGEAIGRAGKTTSSEGSITSVKPKHVSAENLRLEPADIPDRPIPRTDYKGVVPKCKTSIGDRVSSPAPAMESGAPPSQQLRGDLLWRRNFETSEKIGPYLLSGLLFNKPGQYILPEAGSNTTTPAIMASWVRGPTTFSLASRCKIYR